MPYVFSTLTASNTYTLTAPGGADLPVVARSVTIAGGSNIPDKRLITPIGVMTEVTDEDYAWLQDNEVFKLHLKNGFLTVRERSADPEQVASDMITRDQSAPLVDADFEAAPVGVNTDGIEGTFKPTAAADDDAPAPKSRRRRA